jgi:hypothetical protein
MGNQSSGKPAGLADRVPSRRRAIAILRDGMTEVFALYDRLPPRARTAGPDPFRHAEAHLAQLRAFVQERAL